MHLDKVYTFIYGLPDSDRAYYDAVLLIRVAFHGPTRRDYAWIHMDDTLIAADRIDNIEN